MAAAPSILPALRDAIVAFLTAEGYTDVVWLGWKEQARQDNQGPNGAARVVFDMRKAKASVGAVRGGPGPRKLPDGTRARVIATRTWKLPVSFWAAAGNAVNEDAQLNELVAMQERVAQAIQQFAYATHHWGADEDWSSEPTERSFGRAMTATLTIEELIFDVTYGAATPNFTITKAWERQI